MMAHPSQLLAILLLEALIGYPAALLTRVGHPVTWIGAVIAGLEEHWNYGSARRRKVAGGALLLVIIVLAAGSGWLVFALLGDVFWGLLLVVAGTTGLAQRSLYDHVRAVEVPLAGGDLAAARAAVAMVVGRDTETMTASDIAVAAIETLAESFCDGVIAPAFWFLVSGLPGLFIAKAINTADSMIGHRDSRYEEFGWAAARADDTINLLPARFSGLLIAAVAGQGMVSRALAVMWRDAPGHASPNGGWPEAAMAGALGRRLGGPVTYAGDRADRAWLGDGPAPGAVDLGLALKLYRRACLLLWALVALLAGAVVWAR